MYTYGVESVFAPDARHGKMRRIEKHYATCSAFVNYDSSYAEGKDYGLPSFGMVGVRLWKDHRKVDVVRLTY